MAAFLIGTISNASSQLIVSIIAYPLLLLILWPIDRQHNFADMRAALHQSMRLRSLFEREGFKDHRLNFSSCQQRPDARL